MRSFISPQSLGNQHHLCFSSKELLKCYCKTHYHTCLNCYLRGQVIDDYRRQQTSHRQLHTSHRRLQTSHRRAKDESKTNHRQLQNSRRKLQNSHRQLQAYHRRLHLGQRRVTDESQITTDSYRLLQTNHRQLQQILNSGVKAIKIMKSFTCVKVSKVLLE